MTKNTRNQSQNSYAGENCHDRAEQQSIPRPEIKVRIRQETRPHPAVSAMRTMKRTRILNNMF